MSGMPAPGADPECDRVRAVIERVAVGDVNALRVLLVGVLRFREVAALFDSWQSL